MATQLANVFFDHWFCEDGLLLSIVSDRDKLFISQFWKVLHMQTGIKLKMLTAYHPKMDRASKWTNKTVIQALRYHVAQNQKGWVRTLPRVRFDLINTINQSAGFTLFQLHMGWSPHLLPLLVPSTQNTEEEQSKETTIWWIHEDISQAQDNLILARVAQAVQADET